MKFKGKSELSNSSKEIKQILSFEMKNAIEELADTYGYEHDIVESLSYSLYVNHTDKSLFKGGKTKFTKAYEKSVNAVIESGAINFEELGFMVYLSTKFTNHEDNYLRLNDEIVGKNEIVRYMLNETDIGMSESSIMRKFKSIEKKKYLLIDEHPTDKKKNSYYLTPLLFYKGRYMDNKAKKALMDVYRGIYKELKEKVDNGELNIELKSSFDKMSDEEILLFIHK